MPIRTCNRSDQADRLGLIRQQYDQMVKYATALRLGTAETEAILRRFTRTTSSTRPTRRSPSSVAR